MNKTLGKLSFLDRVLFFLVTFFLITFSYDLWIAFGAEPCGIAASVENCYPWGSHNSWFYENKSKYILSSIFLNFCLLVSLSIFLLKGRGLLKTFLSLGVAIFPFLCFWVVDTILFS